MMIINRSYVASLDTIPALEPPPGVTSDFAHPDTQAPAVVGFASGITALMLVFVILRFMTKALVIKKWAQEDVYCICGTILSIIYMGLVDHIFQTGWGAHQWDIPLSVVLDENTIKCIKAASFLYGFAIIFAKLSILALYYRLFSPIKVVRYMIWFGVVLTILLHLAAIFALMFVCTPSDAIGYAECAPQTDLVGKYAGVINIFSDFYVLIIPIMAVSPLQMDWKRKAGIIAIFGAGLLACGSSIASLVYRIQISHVNDLSWWLAPVFIFTVFEFNAGLIIGCMPIIPALFKSDKMRFAFPRSLSSRAFGSRGRTSHGSSAGSSVDRSSGDQTKMSQATKKSEKRLHHQPPPMGVVRVTKTFDAESFGNSDHESKTEEMV